ncbi:MAG: DEAD/DEAH box helicase [Desulfurococcaceae archaeon]
MAEGYKDQLTLDLNRYLEGKYPRSGASVIYEKVEETEEPEPGPSIYEIGLQEQLIKVLEKRGIQRLYRFQYDAYRHILDGDNVVIVAGTGTGKTEAFFIPLAKRILEERAQNPRVLLLYPTKALARDQVKRFMEYSIYGKLGVNIYDGDTPVSARRRVASSPPPILVSNPDMLHVGLIYSPHIGRFIRTADVFVFDELHVYEGVLGSHLHHLVHRIKLTRNKSAQFLASSATIGNPRELAESIFEEKFEEVKGSPARKGTVVHILISTGHTSRWNVVSSVVKFLANNELRFLVFVDSQQLAEVLASIIESRYDVNVAVHRAGLPPDVRKDIESKLREGVLQGVVATPTLELGIDIGALDAVLMAAPPPSYAKYLQRAGRAGRRRKGYVITVLGEDPIDFYYVTKPSTFFDQELTPSVIEPLNEEVIKLHVVSYTLQAGKVHVSRIPLEWRKVLENLVRDRLVKRVGPYIIPVYRTGRAYVAEKGGIRAHGEVIEVVDLNGDRVIATRELPIGVLELHPGAIYFYMKRPYEVVKLDITNKRAYVREATSGMEVYTRPLYTVNVVDYDIIDEKASNLGVLSYAKVLQEVIVSGYVVKNVYSGETYVSETLSEPVTYRYVTRATLIKIPPPEDLDERGLAEAFHAIEHALISASRIACGTGLTDLGGISYSSGDIVIYDTAIGGSGAAKLLYAKFERAVEVVYELMSRCPCEDGCPRCIYSPYCGNNNKVLSKKKAIHVLHEVLSGRAVAEAGPLIERAGRPLA